MDPTLTKQNNFLSRTERVGRQLPPLEPHLLFPWKGGGENSESKQPTAGGPGWAYGEEIESPDLDFHVCLISDNFDNMVKFDAWFHLLK